MRVTERLRAGLGTQSTTSSSNVLTDVILDTSALVERDMPGAVVVSHGNVRLTDEEKTIYPHQILQQTVGAVLNLEEVFYNYVRQTVLPSCPYRRIFIYFYFLLRYN